jgi:acid phosphatase family membrane protein YuiD
MNLPLFLIPILVGLTAQFSKRFFNRRYLSAIKLQGLPLPRYGGMPSAHAAFSFSLLTTVGMADGIASATFAIACAATIFILDDALRMRIFLGRHGEVLRRLIRKLPPS